jgi:hypothetical protein
MKIYLTLFALCMASLVNAQVGIGTNTPLARLHVVDSSVLFSAPGDVPGTPTATPISGPGRRMMWYADKAAFRAGYVGSYASSYWDMSNIGKYSFATGFNTRASGEHSFAAGYQTYASGVGATALGSNSIASGDRSFSSAGYASGLGSIAMGINSQSGGEESVALGSASIATGVYAITIGPSIASGDFAVAIGLQNRAAARFAMALGKNARAIHQGACVIGDASAQFTSDSVYSSGNNQMTMRFTNGYRLFTSMNLSSGVEVFPGGGSWSSMSDKRKKTNFKELNKEEILTKVAALPVTSWNYKTQPAEQRHIGPMAQDFYAAFHLDGVGNNTTINTIDIDGVNMVAIQALEKRTTQLQQENDQLKKQLESMNQRLEALEKLINKQDNPKNNKVPATK